MKHETISIQNTALPEDDWGNGNQAPCLKCLLDLLEIPPAALGHKIDPGHKVDPEFTCRFCKEVVAVHFPRAAGHAGKCTGSLSHPGTT